MIPVGGGGGTIEVVPAALQAVAADLVRVADQTAGDEGSLGAGRAGPGACDPRAAGACADMQAAVEAALALLQRGTGALAADVVGASAAYVETDVGQFRGVAGTGGH